MRPPSPDPLPPIQPLGVAPYPAEGEHFGSYVRRLASDNGFSSVGALAKYLGLLTLTPQSSEKTWSRLLEATGIDRSRLDDLRMHHRGEGRRKVAFVDGVEIQSGFLDRVLLRSCPLCLKEHGLVPTRFAIRQVTSCRVHGVLLDDTCPCGRRRRAFERRSLWDCPSCGMPASEITPCPADPREVRIGELLFTETTPLASMLPLGLLAEPLSARAAFVERLGRLGMLERNDRPSASKHNITAKAQDTFGKDRRICDDREVVLTAADLLEGWPAAYHALLERLLDRHPDGSAAKSLLRRFSSEAGHLAIRSFVHIDSRIIPFAEDARVAFLERRLGYARNKKISVPKAGQYAEMPGTISGLVAGPKALQDFVPAYELATRLHVGCRSNIGSWFEAGLINATRHTDGNVVVKRSEFDKLMARIHSLPDAPGDDAEFEPSASCNNHRGPFYRQRYFIEDILSGRIRSRDAGHGSEGMASRLIHQADFERRRVLCKTAVQIINDDFVGVPSCVRALWRQPMPQKSIINQMRASGRLRTIAGKARHLVAVRDFIALLQEDTAQEIFLLSSSRLQNLKVDGWRSIVVEDSCYASVDPS
jgi:hypothetical protein